MRYKTLIKVGLGLCVVGLFLPAKAGEFTVDFDTDPSAILDVYSNLPRPPGNWRATGGNPGGYLAITDAAGSQYSVIRFQDFDQGMLVKAFTFKVDVRMGNGTTERPADGMSVNFARANDPIFTDPTQWTGNVNGIDLGAEGGTSTGLAVSFDAWQGNPLPDGNDIEGIIVRVDDKTVLRHSLPTRNGTCEDPTSLQTGPYVSTSNGDPSVLCWQPLEVELDENQKLTVKWKGTVLLDKAEVAYFPSAGRLVFMGRTGGANQNQHIDNIYIKTIPASEPQLVEGTATATDIILKIQDAPGIPVDPNSVKVWIQTNQAQVTVSKVGDITTIKYTSPTLLPPGLVTVRVEYKDTRGNSYVNVKDVVVPQYVIIPADYKVTNVDTTSMGFRIRPYQTTASNPNSLAWTEEQLAGVYGPNLVDLSTILFPVKDGYIEWPLEIDFKNSSGGAGNFGFNYSFADVGIPGPGVANEDNSTLEILAYLYFPKAGMYRMGVNSDDGFRVQTANDARDKFATICGQFDGGRGASDTIFNIYIPEPGYYHFRLLWENGGGGAAVEWFTVKDDGTKVLINDATDPDAIKAYMYAATAAPYVKEVIPAPNATNVRNDSQIKFVIQEAGTAVDTGSIVMQLNNVTVTPQVSRAASQTTITYTSPELLPRGTNTVSITWKLVGATQSRTDTWSFVTMNYQNLPMNLWSALDSVDTTKPGFMVKVYQINRGDASGDIPHSPDFADALLAGALYHLGQRAPNIADLTGFGADGYYVETGVINYNQDYETGNIGNFANDKKIPGIPGTTGSTDNFATEIKTYVVFPKAGFYVMGVNSDDGFRVSVGEKPGRYPVEVVAPAEIAGPVAALPTIRDVNGSFGAPLPYPPIQAPVAYVGTACDAASLPDLTGKIAVIDRGGCTFVQKALNVQQKGALAAIIINATAPNDFPFVMGGDTTEVTIPCLMISKSQADALAPYLDRLVVSIGRDPNLMLGQYYGGRGASDTLFGFYVPQAGVWPLRLVWWEGGGGANCEWFTVTSTGKKVLLNDPTDPDALKVYRVRTAAVQPEIKKIALQNGQVVIEFTGTLQSAPEITGPWSDVPNASSPYMITPTGKRQFFRARQ